jgi:hypothetical protein
MESMGVPFSCRLEDTTSGIERQQATSAGNWQPTEPQEVRQLQATSGIERQHPATTGKARC